MDREGRRWGMGGGTNELEDGREGGTNEWMDE